MPHCFVPPYLLERILAADPDAGSACAETLAVDQRLRASRALQSTVRPGAAPTPAAATAAWIVHTADNTERLPGDPVRSAGEPESGDAAVDEAAAGVVAALALTAYYGRDSYDDNGATVLATVHYGRDYVNALWDGEHLVFGDGDGKIFERFTKPIDVIGHEFAHAVTDHTAGLVYRDQPGALNESVSDVFAACMKQRLLGQQVTDADWLIGTDLFRPGISARGLRDMAAPGTAYDDPLLGQDPQVGHLDDLVVTSDDNGGVHLNSGIPNRAFHLAATAIGGTAWEGAGRIWWTALTDGSVRSTTDFAGFAAATIAVAGDHRAAVREAWAGVGVTTGAAEQPPASSPAAALVDALVVRRSGGFLGRTVEAQQSLSADEPRAREARDLLARVDLAAAAGGLPSPDMFVYTFEVPGQPAVRIPERQLTGDLQRLAALVLGDDGGSVEM